MTASTPTQQDARPRVQSVARAARILIEVAQSPAGLTTKEIAERLGIHVQTAYHLIHTLIAMGLLTRKNDRCVLGLRFALFAEAFERHLAPAEHLASHVREVARMTGETAQAAGWWEGEIATLAITRGRFAVQAAASPYGQPGDGHARATGKLLLAHLSEGARAEYLERNPLRPLTENTITDLARFEQELELIRAQGHAVDNEEYALGLCCLAVPLEETGSPYVLGLSAPTDRFLRSRDEYLATLTEAARAALSDGSPSTVPA